MNRGVVSFFNVSNVEAKKQTKKQPPIGVIKLVGGAKKTAKRKENRKEI